MLQYSIKASAVTHLTDARYFAAWEVNYLGFDLSSGGVSVHELNAFREWITGPRIVGELDAGLPALIEAGTISAETLASLQLDAVQVDAIFEPENIEQYLHPLNIPVILEITIEGYGDLEDLQDKLNAHQALVSLNILNFTKGGITWQDLAAGNPFSLERLSRLTQQFPVYLEIEGCGPIEMMKALPELQGFSVRGGSEEKVGYKDFDGLDEFFEEIEVFE